VKGVATKGGAPAGAAKERSAVLQAFERALGRETHLLRERPEILWQQMHNWLQWEEGLAEERLAPQRGERDAAGGRPWLRRLTRSGESEALVRTLAGHTGSVRACAYSPDGRRIVSVRDAQSGEKIPALPFVKVPGPVAVHPWLPCAARGDGVAFWRVELRGVESGPIIVTAGDGGQGPLIRCPKCWHQHPVGSSVLGSALTCPTPDCGLLLRVNEFMVAVAAR
jgi:hypothetical protein